MPSSYKMKEEFVSSYKMLPKYLSIKHLSGPEGGQQCGDWGRGRCKQEDWNEFLFVANFPLGKASATYFLQIGRAHV